MLFFSMNISSNSYVISIPFTIRTLSLSFSLRAATHIRLNLVGSVSKQFAKQWCVCVSVRVKSFYCSRISSNLFIHSISILNFRCSCQLSAPRVNTKFILNIHVLNNPASVHLRIRHCRRATRNGARAHLSAVCSNESPIRPVQLAALRTGSDSLSAWRRRRQLVHCCFAVPRRARAGGRVASTVQQCRSSLDY